TDVITSTRGIVIGLLLGLSLGLPTFALRPQGGRHRRDTCQRSLAAERCSATRQAFHRPASDACVVGATLPSIARIYPRQAGSVRSRNVRRTFFAALRAVRLAISLWKLAYDGSFPSQAHSRKMR